MLSEIIGSFLINSYLNIPEDRLTAANITFQFSILTFAVQIIRVPYNCCVVAHERMAFYAYNSLWEVFLKLGMVFLLMFLPFSKLELYAFLMFLVSFFNYLAYRFYCLHCKLIQKYEFVRNSSSFKEILGFISWNMLSSTSITIQKQIINIAINAYCGVIANAAVGLATQLSAGVSTFVSNFQLAFNPRLMKLYASRQFEELKKNAAMDNETLCPFITPFFNTHIAKPELCNPCMVETNTDLFGCIQFIVHHGIYCCSHIYPIDDCHTCCRENKIL